MRKLVITYMLYVAFMLGITALLAPDVLAQTNYPKYRVGYAFTVVGHFETVTKTYFSNSVTILDSGLIQLDEVVFVLGNMEFKVAERVYLKVEEYEILEYQHETAQ